jgi:DNA-binding beta-propeller fold protein YncE
MIRRRRTIAPPLLALLLVGCPSSDSGDDDDAPTPALCADSVPGEVAVIATGFVDSEGTVGTEGIAFSPEGRMFVGARDVIAEVFPDGSWQQIAAVPGSIGFAWWGEHLLVAASDSGLGNDLDGVHLVDVDSGEVTLLGEGLSGANFITVTPWGTLLVSDPGEVGILEQDGDGNVTSWQSELESPNGMVFSADTNTLYVATTFENPAPLWAVPLVAHEPQTPENLVEWAAGNVPDGLAIGQSGTVYVSQNIAGRIDAVTAEGAATELAWGVDYTASIAFGEGEGWDPCSLYSTSLFGGDIYRIGVGEAGLTPWR